jgi:hypothetical protein
VRLEARKGTPLMGGAHTTTQSIFQRFGCEGGANPLGGVRKRGDGQVRGCVKVIRWVG